MFQDSFVIKQNYLKTKVKMCTLTILQPDLKLQLQTCAIF